MPQFNYYGQETTPKPDEYTLVRDDTEAAVGDKTKQIAIRDFLMHTFGYYDASAATLSISGSAALLDTSPAVQLVNTSGSSGVTLSLPGATNDSHPFAIIHTGGSASGAITLDDADATVVRPGEARLVFPTSTNFRVLMGSLTVTEEDASPSVQASTIKFSNGTVTDNGDGSVSVNNLVESDPIWAAKGDLAVGTASDTATILPSGSANGQKLVVASAETTGLRWINDTFGWNIIIGTGAAEIAGGVAGDIEVPYNCKITSVRLLADQSGSIVIDIWKDTYANYPPTDADTITSATPPTITTATKSEDTTLSSWTVDLTAGNILRFNVDSCTTIEQVTVSIRGYKTAVS
jgi:hypothetical protein